MRRSHVIVSGDVHGVGFRALTQHRAKKLKVSGWVRNNPDGTVEAVFEGEDHSVNDMIEWCKKGPPTSYVENVEVTEEKFSGEFKTFEIVY
jgi:acylphosphatase